MIDCITSDFSKISCLLGDNFDHLQNVAIYNCLHAISKDEYKRRFQVACKTTIFINIKGD